MTGGFWTRDFGYNTYSLDAGAPLAWGLAFASLGLGGMLGPLGVLWLHRTYASSEGYRHDQVAWRHSPGPCHYAARFRAM
jgi:hypothetical protein